MGRHKRGEDDTFFKDAMLVGCSQILALLFPGFSRSGATMSTALVLDLYRVAATRLSFFLGIPALTGAGIYARTPSVPEPGALPPEEPLVHGTGTLAEATGLSKSRIGATLREATPVLAALGHTCPTSPFTVTTAGQLAAIAGHVLGPE